jgi:hypothetical protein
VGAVGAKVLFKRFLRKAVEGERCHGALETRSGRPHGQWEQHQPVKSSPSTQINRLLIHLLPFACVLGLELGGDRRNTSTERARKVNSCPPPHRQFSTELQAGKVTQELRPEESFKNGNDIK